jgi:hypothetical protein
MIRIFLSALLALSLQANAAVVLFNPSSTTVDVGQIFEVGVEGSDFDTELDGGGLNLSFDPNVLQVLDVVFAPGWNFFVYAGDIDNTRGTITGTEFNQFGSAKVGSFPILSYKFQAIALGTSLLQLTEYSGNPFASDGGLVPISFPVFGSISAVPEPGTYAMLLAGLGLLAFLRMQRHEG